MPFRGKRNFRRFSPRRTYQDIEVDGGPDINDGDSDDFDIRENDDGSITISDWKAEITLNPDGTGEADTPVTATPIYPGL